MPRRPLLLHIGPDRLRIGLWGRLYRNSQSNWTSLYRSASLRHCQHVTMDLVPGDTISDCIAFTGVYEPVLTRRVVELAGQGGTLVDIGANLGYFSLLWAGSNSSNKSIAFEASPRNIEFLRRNIGKNQLDSRITVIPSPVGVAASKLWFDTGPPAQTGWGGLTLERTAGSIAVDVLRVDEVLGCDHPIALLKVDIEGADTWALMGCERLLQAGVVREIWYEQNKPRMAALGIPPDAPQHYLRSVGYIPTPHGNAAEDLVEWSAVKG